jgi:hypothetical protein
MTKLVQAAPVQSSVSWWIDPNVPRAGFTRYVTTSKDENGQTHQARMAVSTLGKGRHRVLTTNELEPR